MIWSVLVALAFSFVVGFASAHTVAAGLGAVLLTAVLAVLETSLSFDNALVNATVLRRMSPVWQQRFLTWGMVIAVFGMRLLFPVLVVSCIAGITPWHALSLAFLDPSSYTTMMEAAHVPLAGFGGGFLSMVALGFFLDPEKDTHWLGFLEKALSVIGRVPGIKILLGVLLVAAASRLPSVAADQASLLFSGVLGILGHLAIEAVGWFSNSSEEGEGSANRSGAAQFIYLELLDASFSFDGVIGAFALTNNLLLISTGLGLGALAVRSLTLKLVHLGSFGQLKFLEHGTFYAIAALAGFLLVGTSIAIPGAVTGGAGAVLIGAAVLHSVLVDRDLRAKIAHTSRRLFSNAMRVGIAGLFLAWSHSVWNVVRGHTPEPPSVAGTMESIASTSAAPPAPTAFSADSTESAHESKASNTTGKARGEIPRTGTVRRGESHRDQTDWDQAQAQSRRASEALSSALDQIGARESEPKVVAEARALLGGLQRREAPAEVLKRLVHDQRTFQNATETLNRFAQIQYDEWESDLAASRSEDDVGLGQLLEVLASHSWGDLLEHGDQNCAGTLRQKKSEDQI